MLTREHTFVPIDSIYTVGDEIRVSPSAADCDTRLGFASSHLQAFDQGTFECLRRLSIAVVGVSGTGSPVAIQLARLGVGELVLVDDDIVEVRNLNRILHSTAADAEAKRSKVEVLARGIEEMGLGTKVRQIKKNLWTPTAVREVGECDIVFGCMDSVDGRFLLNLLASHYNQPYFDIGIRIATRKGLGGHRPIEDVCGTVHYLKPGGSSLLTRGLFTMNQVSEAGLRRDDPEAYAAQAGEGYITGVVTQRPAVISVNMLAASLAVNELLARLHPFREESNERYASVGFSLGSMELFCDPECATCPIIASRQGLGDVVPLLGLSELSAA
ncbi:MAG: ThiF family adenylyltransferase [Vulcanimicrobiota bacterium]